MTEPTPVPRKIHEAEIQDRTVKFYELTEGQVTQMSRSVVAAQRANFGKEAVPAIARMVNVIIANFVDDDDRDWIEDGLTDGSIGLDDLMEPMRVLASNGDGIQDEPPRKAVTRGRR